MLKSLGPRFRWSATTGYYLSALRAEEVFELKGTLEAKKCREVNRGIFRWEMLPEK